jgi:hypothetical protein
MRKCIKEKKQEQKERKIFEKEQREPIELLNQYFPKGNKLRGEAMAILALAFWSGVKAEREISELNKSTKNFNKEKSN